MPAGTVRARDRDRDRQRRRKISLACEPCRERKSRCDGGKPICSMCQRRSLGLEQCVYKLDNARTASTDEYIRVLHDRIRRLERVCHDANVQVPALDSHLIPDSALDDAPMSIITTDGGGLTPVTPTTAQLGGPQSAAHPRYYLAHARRGSGTVAGPGPGFGAGAGAGDPALPERGQRGSIALSSPPNAYDPGSMQSHEEPDPASGVTAMGTIIGEDDVSASDDFYGSSSTASFLKEAFDTMKAHGSSAFAFPGGPRPLQPSNPSPQTATTTASRRDQASYIFQAQKFSLPPRDLGDHLMERFRTKIYYMYPFFHMPSFERAYRSLWQQQPGPDDEPSMEPMGSNGQPLNLGLGCYPDADAGSIVFHCAMNAMFAMACHFSDLPPADRLAASHTFFVRAKAFVGLDLIDANNLGVVQALLVIALVLQSTPYPSRCWNAAGLACRVAQGLGLHTEHRQDARDDLEKEIRRRTWHGCVVMDMLVGMTYGRPTMVTQLSSLPLPSGIEESPAQSSLSSTESPRKTSPRFRFYVESIRLCGILEEILSKVYQPWVNRGSATQGESHDAAAARAASNMFSSLDTIVGLHTKLSKFAASLPPPLSWTDSGHSDSMSDLSPEDASLLRVQKTVLYARFTYLRIMLLRPVLTQLCVNEHTSTGNDGGPSASDPLLAGTMLHCAKTCVEASVELLDLVQDTYQSQATGAWWWDALYACTAGLVLVMARTCPSLWPSLDKHSLRASWQKCEEILKFVASFSVSGQQSLKMLQLIHGVVNSAQASKQQSPAASPKPGFTNDMASALLQAVPFESGADFNLSSGADLQGFEDLGMMGTFFNWDTSLIDAANGIMGGDLFQ